MTPRPADWVPVESCTLPTAEQPLRVAEFDDLFGASLRAVETSSAVHTRLVLEGDGTLPDRVRRLADAEASCCSFFTFTLATLGTSEAVPPDRTVVALDIEVPVTRSDVLSALVQRAEQALAAGAQRPEDDGKAGQ
ncbi:hypothetical protein E4P38_01280 [Blastococcus sp. CT_GayMR16]|nr:hypothetical protein E4P38_01280 [Blastococcus sp. CT_GayMR16]